MGERYAAREGAKAAQCAAALAALDAHAAAEAAERAVQDELAGRALADGMGGGAD